MSDMFEIRAPGVVLTGLCVKETAGPVFRLAKVLTVCSACGSEFKTSYRVERTDHGNITRNIPQCNDCRHRYPRSPRKPKAPAALPRQPGELRVGDRVVCVDVQGHSGERLTMGRVYTLSRVDPGLFVLVYLVEHGESESFFGSRFRLA